MAYPTVDLNLRERDEPLHPDELFALPPFDSLRVDPTTGAETRFAEHVRRRPGAVALRFFERGDVICHQGEPGWTAFYIPRDEELHALRRFQIGFAEADGATGDDLLDDVEDAIRGEVLEIAGSRRVLAFLAHDLRLWGDHPRFDEERTRAAKEARAILETPPAPLGTPAQREILAGAKPKKALDLAARRDLARVAEAERDRLERMARLLRVSADRPPSRPPADERRVLAEQAASRIRRRVASSLELDRLGLVREIERLDVECDALDRRVRALLALASRERWRREVEILEERARERATRADALEAVYGAEPALVIADGDERVALLDRVERERPDLEEEVELARDAIGKKRRVAVVVDAPDAADGDEIQVASMYEGEFFGEISVLGRAVRCATVRAVADGWILELTGNVLEEVLKAGEVGERVAGIFRRRIVASRLREVPAFLQLDRERYMMLCHEAQLVDFPYGATVFGEGELPDAFYVVNSGYVRLSSERSPGRVLAILGPGEVVGLTSMVQRKPRQATCTAHGHPPNLARPMRSSWAGQVQLIKIDARLCDRLGAIT